MKSGLIYIYCLGFLTFFNKQTPLTKNTFLDLYSSTYAHFVEEIFTAWNSVQESVNLSQVRARLQSWFSFKKYPMVPAYWINSHKHYIGLKKTGNHLGINYLKIDTHSTLFRNIMVEMDMA